MYYVAAIMWISSLGPSVFGGPTALTRRTNCDVPGLYICVEDKTWAWCSKAGEVLNPRRCKDRCAYKKTELGLESYCYPHGWCADTCP